MLKKVDLKNVEHQFTDAEVEELKAFAERFGLELHLEGDTARIVVPKEPALNQLTFEFEEI